MFDSITTNKLIDIPTPYFLYDLDLLNQTLNTAKLAANKYNIHVHYALKANYNLPLLRKIIEVGFGADCVSGPEIEKAIESGFSNNKILMAGVGKTDQEIVLALDSNIACLNCESLEEIEVIATIAKFKNQVAPIALRINPDVAAFTHKYITTGTEDDKFGIAIKDLPEVIKFIEGQSSLNLIGLHFHIGSQISDNSVFDSLCDQVNKINKWFIDQGIQLPMVNMGGGLSIDYLDPDNYPIPNFEEHFFRLRNGLQIGEDQQIHVELGRSIIGQCGNLVSKILYKKKTTKKEFLILDAGMTELMRPALYQAHHHIEHLNKRNELSQSQLYTVVGPICESSDTFGKDVTLPISNRGDILIIRSAGAYGEVMSSSYNLRKKADVKYIENGYLDE